ncbi:hypothetical protein ACGFZK_32565 [Streptomyces sp. NPDC048257]|uniref:hypothetical protein n=1 Tax=Streptomyces sp. NPDC048257 TaxID=3365526 RepID=UPI00371B6BE9
MSASITVRCDRTGQYGSCPTQLFTTTSDADEAYAYASRLGWTVNGTPDYCPQHSSNTRPTPAVVPLHLREP